MDEVEEFSLKHSFKEHTSYCHSVCFSPDGTKLCSSSADSTIILYNLESYKRIAKFEGHSGTVWCTDFSNTGKCITSGSSDKTVRLWEVGVEGTVTSFAVLKHHKNSVYGVRFSNDGRIVFSMGFDSKIYGTSLLDLKLAYTLEEGDDFVLDGDVLNDERTLISGHHGGVMKLWDLRIQKCVHSYRSHSMDVYSVRFNPLENTLIASGSEDSTVRLHDIRTHKEIQSFDSIHERSVREVCFHPTQPNFILTGSQDETMKIIDSQKKKVISSVKIDKWFCSAKFSPTNLSLVASCGTDKTVKIWKSNCMERKLISTVDEKERLSFLLDRVRGTYGSVSQLGKVKMFITIRISGSFKNELNRLFLLN